MDNQGFEPVEKLRIIGGRRLTGTVQVSGAKNAAVAVVPAALLCDGPTVIDNLPYISDVFVMYDILKGLGVDVSLEGNGRMRVDPSSLSTHSAVAPMMQHMRASYYMLPVLLSRFGKAEVALPGGCRIGRRPIDQHIKGLRAMGAQIEVKQNTLIAQCDQLRGCEVFFDCITVGATVNMMLAAVKAKGTTTLINAAKEPHVVDLANFLISCGARIKGAGTDTVRITGVPALHGTTYVIIPDQIETGTLMVAAAATCGDVTISGVIPTHNEAQCAKLVEMGVDIIEGDDSLRVRRDRPIQAVSIKTLTYPGFPTDLQQPFTALLTCAKGVSRITENIYESRYRHIDQLNSMGAKIRIEDRVAIVEGVDELHGTQVVASDLRAGAALLIAALMAQGETIISNVKYIDRGYEQIEKKLINLGAQIERFIAYEPVQGNKMPFPKEDLSE